LKHALKCLATLLLLPLAAICGAAEIPQPVAKHSLSLPAKADLPDVGKLQGNRYNVLFIAIDEMSYLVSWVGCNPPSPVHRALRWFFDKLNITPKVCYLGS
jgi:hypothetical protein